jgi:predicted DNA-binding transcriptional regulator YafY
VSDTLRQLSARERVRSAEVRRLVRLLQIVQAVASEPRRWQRAELAVQHGVSERTITKDLAILRAAGLYVRNDGVDNPGYYFASDAPELPLRPSTTKATSPAASPEPGSAIALLD